jgi:hypothetical protein
MGRDSIGKTVFDFGFELVTRNSKLETIFEVHIPNAMARKSRGKNQI